MSNSYRVACVQLTSAGDVARNLEAIDEHLRTAKSMGAELVTLPENFAFMGPEKDRLAAAERVDSKLDGGPITRFLSAAAKLHDVDIVASGMPEQGPDSARTYNTSVHVRRDGSLGAMYRKIHLFDVDLADGTSLKESKNVAPGSDIVVSQMPFGAMGLAVCYDVRFPELFRELGKKGMRVLVIGAAFTLHTGRDHWHTLLAARAIENQCFVIAPAQYGRHAGNENRVTYGRSVIYDPWGVPLAIAPDKNGVIVAELDFSQQDRIRRELPALQHRRV